MESLGGAECTDPEPISEANFLEGERLHRPELQYPDMFINQVRGLDGLNLEAHGLAEVS